MRIVIGFGAGAVADTPARLLAQKFSQSLGPAVRGREPAGRRLEPRGRVRVARAPKDGYTLFMGTAANTINATISPNLTFDFAKDFAPIALVASVPNILVAHPSLGVDNLKDLIALAKQKPEQIHYRLVRRRDHDPPGGRTDQRDGGREADPRAVSGQRASLTDVLAGRIPLLFTPASAAMQHVEKGSLKAIAVTQLQRAGIAPNIPTMSEAGLTGYDIGLWFGLLAPAGTPREIVDKLARAPTRRSRRPMSCRP